MTQPQIDFNLDEASLKDLMSKRIFSKDAKNSNLYSSIKQEIVSIKHIIRSMTPVFTGTAQDNVYDMIYGSPVDLTGVVFTTGVPHWLEIELGRAPGNQPSREDIEPWTEYKLGDASLWYVVARKIGKYGFPGKYIWKRVKEAAEVNIGKSFAARFGKLL